ncbi:DNA polymerase III subunit delta [Mycoplasma sp. 6243]|uniref:DNA polymerase III subunit delta n=1 Tax=Mycoplasma sp. 6243 TaxID=3440865 RepID=UPI003EB71FC3
MHFIIGDEEFFINREINKIKEKFLDENIFTYRENYNLLEILDEISSENLFEQPKLFIVYNLNLLTATKTSEKDKEIIEYFKKVFMRQNKNALILVLNQIKYARNNLTDFILSAFKVIELHKINKYEIRTQIGNFIRSKGTKISQSNLIYLLEKLPENLFIIQNEVEKMTSYTDNLTKDIIDDFISDYKLNNQFAFINSIESKDVGKIYQKYLERSSEGDNEITLMSQIFSIFSLADRVYNLKELEYTDYDIMQQTKLQDWRYKKILQVIKLYGIKKIHNILINLAELDIQLKSSEVPSNVLFEIFLITNFT